MVAITRKHRQVSNLDETVCTRRIEKATRDRREDRRSVRNWPTVGHGAAACESRPCRPPRFANVTRKRMSGVEAERKAAEVYLASSAGTVG